MLKECETVEFKTATDKLPRTIWETYSSFANTDGGIIYLGVKEDMEGNPIYVGVSDVNKILNELWTNLNNPKKVNYNLLKANDVTVEKINGNDIIKINIPKASRDIKPVYINNMMQGGTYIRQGDGDFKCNEYELSAMLRDKRAKSYDSEVLLNFSLNDLCQETIDNYRNDFERNHPRSPWNRLNDEEFLLRVGALIKQLGKVYCTKAGLLMFGYEYSIKYEFPNYFMDYRENMSGESRYDDRVDTASCEYTGNIYDFCYKILYKLEQTLPVPFRMRDTKFRDTEPDSKYVIREAVINALTNADFYGKNNVIIKRSKDKLEISNSGGFRVPITSGISDPRNVTIMNMFRHVNLVERAGTGIQTIFDISKQYNWNVEYKEDFSPERVLLTISGIDKYKYKLDEVKNTDTLKMYLE